METDILNKKKDGKLDLSDKCITIYDNGLFVELAVKMAKHFGKVNYYMPWKSAFPTSNTRLVGTGIPNVNRIYDFFDHVDETDIFVFPDIYDGDLQLFLQNMGKLVFGSRKGEEMEVYRGKMKEHMKSLGLPVNEYKIVTGLEALRKYLKTHENVYVKVDASRGDFETFHSPNYKIVEPQLDQLEWKLGAKKYVMEFLVESALDDCVEVGYDGYVVDGQFPQVTCCGIEIKDLGYLAIKKEYKDFPKEITGFNETMVDTFKKYGYRGFMSTELRVGKDKKPYMIDFCSRCFDKETEILTDNGWKLFKDLLEEDLVATLNIDTKTLEFQKPINYIEYEYDGKMINFTNRRNSFDCLVTPNHEILRYDRHKKKLFKEEASNITDKGYIPRTALWEGVYEEFFILEGYSNSWASGKHLSNLRTLELPELKIKMNDFLELLGWYLSEGSIRNVDNTIQISQTKYKNELRTVLDKLPFKYVEEDKGFFIQDKRLAKYLSQFGLCYDKFVPTFVKNLTKEQIRIFLEAFKLGDGGIHKGNNLYFSTSYTLISDLQELLLRLGSVGNIVTRKTKGTSMSVGSGKIYIRNHDIYILNENNHNFDYWFETGNRKELYIKEVDYNDMVYCVTTPNSTVYVRRNGKPTFCGNCGSPPNELYQEMYENLHEIIWYGAQGICVDPIIKYKFGMEVLIHSQWADKNWQSVQFPPELRDNIKFRNLAIINNEYYVVPQSCGLPEIGAIVAFGNTIDETIQNIKNIACQIEGYFIDIPLQSLDKGLEEIKKAEALGIKIF